MPVVSIHTSVREGTVKRGDGRLTRGLQALRVARLDQEVERDATREVIGGGQEGAASHGGPTLDVGASRVVANGVGQVQVAVFIFHRELRQRS